ncbi:MAG: DUF885 family protein, partial [Desulfobacterales bacterium]
MSPETSPASVSVLAETVFRRLAQQFPICTGSDEFHFFPHIPTPEACAFGWDDFSLDALQDLDRQMARWLRHLAQLAAQPLSWDDRVDVDVLQAVLFTLREQLTDVGWHRSQPTWYLTIMGIGLAEAVTATPEHLTVRMQTLPGFLSQARQNLRRIPVLFRDLACEMIGGLLAWLQTLPATAEHLTAAAEALQTFLQTVKSAPTTEDFLPDRDLYERMARHHMRCGLGTDDIARELKEEIRETRSELEALSHRLAPGRTWQATLADLPPVTPPPNGARALYQAAIADLAGHCIKQGLVSKAFLKRCPVRVESIPDFMRPVRSNAAYSMPAGHPPRGGTFFIMANRAASFIPADYRLLSAHETLPGHHLLDSRRWEHGRTVRRHVEFPLFYEGWASFGEELLFDTGHFGGPVDRLLMAKRRFWRAMRGRVDLEIHTRQRRFDQAASLLIENGLPARQARGMVQR